MEYLTVLQPSINDGSGTPSVIRDWFHSVVRKSISYLLMQVKPIFTYDCAAAMCGEVYYS